MQQWPLQSLRQLHPSKSKRLFPTPVMGRFSGENPLDWIIQTEKYFIFYNILSEHKLSWASLYLDGEALEWYLWLFRNKQLAGWDHFVDKLFIRFRSRKVHNNHLDFLQPFPTVDDYQAQTAVIPSWSTIANSPSPWNEPSDYTKLNSAHQVFDEKLHKTPATVVGVENASMLIKSDNAEMLTTQANEEIFHSVLDETKEEADFHVRQYCSEPLMYNNNEAHKVFDGFSTASNDVTLESHKMLMMAIDLIGQIDYATEVRNQGKNEEEEILTIGNVRQLVPTSVEIPRLWTGSIFSSFSGLAIFNMQHGLGIARRSEEMSRMLSVCSYDQLINRGIIDHFGRFGHVSLMLTLHLFSPDQCGIAFPFDPGSHLLNVFLRVPRKFVYCIPSGDLDHDKVIISTLWNSCVWVDTRQEQNLLFLYKSRELGREQKIQGLLVTCVALYLEWFPTILVNNDDVLLFALIGVVHISKPTLSYLVLNLDPYLVCDISALLFGKIVDIFCQWLYLDELNCRELSSNLPHLIRILKRFNIVTSVASLLRVNSCKQDPYCRLFGSYYW